MYATATNPYQQQAAETAGPAQLVLMLYDGILAALRRSQVANEDGQIEVVNRELVRAQDILTELLVTLDYDQGGQIAANLGSVYRFCIEQLIEANITKDLSELGRIAELVSGVRQSWEQACCTLPAAAV